MGRLVGEKRYVDQFGFAYDIVSWYSNGYVLYQKDSPCQWVICVFKEEGDQFIRFETEAELWEYALDNKLFKRKAKRKVTDDG